MTSTGSPDIPDSAGWKKLSDVSVAPQSHNVTMRRVANTVIALCPVSIVGLLVLGNEGSDWLRAVFLAPACLGPILVLGRITDHLEAKRGLAREQRRRERMAAWACPHCGKQYTLDSQWTGCYLGGKDWMGFDLGGKDWMGFDKTGWSDQIRSFRADGIVQIRCVHCERMATFLERNGRGVHLPDQR